MMARSTSLLWHPNARRHGASVFARAAGQMPALVCLVAVALGTGCEETLPLRVEIETRAAFDPTRFDAGPAPAASATQPARLRFGITPFYSPDRQRRMLDRVQAYLSEKVGIPITAVVFPDYKSCVDALARGDLELAQLSPYAFVEAENEIADIVPIVSTVAQGSMTYGSYLVARRDSGIDTWQDFKGKRIGFIDRLSASGYLYPRIFLEDKGFDIANDFKEVKFMGMHDRALAALLNDEIDVAAVSSDTLVNANVMGIQGPVRVIAKPGRIPYDAIVVRKTLPARVRWGLRKAFLTLSIHTPEGQAILEDYNLINGFMPPPKNHYNEIRLRARKLEKKPFPSKGAK